MKLLPRMNRNLEMGPRADKKVRKIEPQGVGPQVIFSTR